MSSAGIVKLLAITAGQSTRGGSVRDAAVLVTPRGVRAFVAGGCERRRGCNLVSSNNNSISAVFRCNFGEVLTAAGSRGSKEGLHAALLKQLGGQEI